MWYKVDTSALYLDNKGLKKILPSTITTILGHTGNVGGMVDEKLFPRSVKNTSLWLVHRAALGEMARLQQI